MKSLCQDAKCLWLMLEYGLATGKDVVDWADSHIIALDSPPPALLDLSMTPLSRTADLLSQLSALAAGADYWEAFRIVLGLEYERIAAGSEDILRLANELYSRMVTTAPIRTVPMDIPEEFWFIYQVLADDERYLAMNGVRDQSVWDHFLAKLQEFQKYKRRLV